MPAPREGPHVNVSRSLALLAALASVAYTGVAASAAPFARERAMPAIRELSFASLRGNYLGPIAPGTPISIYVHVQGRHEEQLAAFVAAIDTPGSPDFGHYLTPQQFGAYFGAAPGEYAQALATLRAAGFTIDKLVANRTDIVAHAPAAVVERFFGSPIDQRSERGRSFFTMRYTPVYPAGLHAEEVSGLETYVRFHSHARRTAHTIESWTPQDLAAGYDLNPLYASGLDGKGVTIANATSGAAEPGDLALFQKHFGLPSAQLISVPIGGPLTKAGNSESSLDVDSALSVAREATFEQVVAYNAYNNDFDRMYSYIVNDLGSSVHVVTTSWGVCEREMEATPAALKLQEGLFAQAAAEGQWWFSASGDNGTDDCDDGGTALSVDFPGSSPYVMSVGGTDVRPTLSGGAVTGWAAETTWQYSNSDGASGGGKSILYKKPAYQNKLTPADGVRDVPDVAALADPDNDGLYVADDGALQSGWGGTSDAAPQWAAVLAIVEQRYGGKIVTDPHVRLYALAATSRYHSLFHDILHGNNGVPLGDDMYYPNLSFRGYNAGAGFDLTTGLGSYIGAALVESY